MGQITSIPLKIRQSIPITDADKIRKEIRKEIRKAGV